MFPCDSKLLQLAEKAGIPWNGKFVEPEAAESLRASPQDDHRIQVRVEVYAVDERSAVDN